MTRQRSGPTRRVHRSLRLAAGVALASSLLAGTVACTGPGETPDGRRSTASAGPSAESATARQAKAPDGATVRVVGSGSSTYQDAVGDDNFSLGVVVENGSSRYSVGNIVLRIHYVDAAGTELAENQIMKSTETLGVALPGKGTAFGYTFSLTTRYPKPARMTAEFVHADWFPPGTANIQDTKIFDYRSLTATDIKTDRTNQERMKVTFAIDSQYPEQLPHTSAVAIFYDSNGAIVGGSNEYASQVRTVAPGRSTGVIQADQQAFPTLADDSRTEVYLKPAQL